jgi:hypothetical protein
MGLRDAKAKVIELTAVWYVKDQFRRALKGEKGPEMQKAALWIMANKGPLGKLLLLLGGMFGAGVAQGVFHGHGFTVAAFVLSYIGTYALGGGTVKSDGYYRPQLDALKAAEKVEGDR